MIDDHKQSGTTTIPFTYTNTFRYYDQYVDDTRWIYKFDDKPKTGVTTKRKKGKGHPIRKSKPFTRDRKVKKRVGHTRRSTQDVKEVVILKDSKVRRKT